MASISERYLTSQSLDTRLIELDGGEQATITFRSARRGKVMWYDGGVSWSLKEKDASLSTFSVRVEHSLLPHGDHWVEDRDSPFGENVQGIELSRMERVRFTNLDGSNTVHIVVASPANYTAEIT